MACKLSLIHICGQCFRPQKLSDGRYRFLSGSALLYLTPLGDGQYLSLIHIYKSKVEHIGVHPPFEQDGLLLF